MNIIEKVVTIFRYPFSRRFALVLVGSNIITELSAGNKELLELIQKLLESCDRITYGETNFTIF